MQKKRRLEARVNDEAQDSFKKTRFEFQDQFAAVKVRASNSPHLTRCSIESVQN
jgi:hypothetical protein